VKIQWRDKVAQSKAIGVARQKPLTMLLTMLPTMPTKLALLVEKS